MNQVNYQKELDKVLASIGNGFLDKEKNGEEKEPPRLFLHSCCAPCSSYVMEYLCQYFRITVFYYNPNISVPGEYQKRAAEEKRLIEAYNSEKKGYPIGMIEGDYDPAAFYGAVKGYEDCKEGGERCFRCFELRLSETARRAAKGQYDYFATTLTISPLKNAQKLNEIGQRLAEEYGVRWLWSDFKKRNGYKRSVELSEQYDLYRQDYCGCSFSRAEAEQRKKERKEESFNIGGNKTSRINK